jgi:hypothetical protein
VFAVLSVHPEGVGEIVAVVLSIPAEEVQRLVSGTETARRDGTDGKPAKVKLQLLPEQYAELGVRMGEITAERADELMEAGKPAEAIRCIDLLNKMDGAYVQEREVDAVEDAVAQMRRAILDGTSGRPMVKQYGY